jgi:hypothetical protein
MFQRNILPPFSGPKSKLNRNDTFRQNGYSSQEIHRTFNSPVRVAPPKDKPDSVPFLLYVRLTFKSF